MALAVAVAARGNSRCPANAQKANSIKTLPGAQRENCCATGHAAYERCARKRRRRRRRRRHRRP